jgi:hypothetical protein
MSRRSKKNNNQGGSTKIDLGLEELLAAVNGNSNERSDPSAENNQTESALEQSLEVESAVKNLYQDYFAKSAWTELEDYCLKNLKDGFNLEAKLWWIRSVSHSGALPKFLLAAPFEEAVAFAKNDNSESELFADLISTISNELSRKVEPSSKSQADSSAIVESEKASNSWHDPNIPLKQAVSVQDLAQLPLQAKYKNRLLTSRQLQLSVLVLVAVLLSISVYFLNFESDQEQFSESLALLSQPKERDSQESKDSSEVVSLDKSDSNLRSDKVADSGSNTKAVLDKLRQEQQVLEEVEQSADQEDLVSEKKKGELRIDDILDMVNEDPEPRGSENPQDSSKESAAIKSRPVFESESDQIVEIDLSGPIEPPQISNVMGLEVSGKSVSQVQPVLIESFPMAGYKEGPQKSATPLTVTRAGSVYTNTSPYAVEIEALQPGDKVWLLERQGVWLKIASREGEVGFIDAQLVS